MYYNTTNETGETLNDSNTRAIKQEDLIYNFFKFEYEEFARPEGFTPSEMGHICLMDAQKDWPLTSIRRAIHTLTESGKLTKTTELRMGNYGKNEHVWRLNVENFRQNR